MVAYIGAVATLHGVLATPYRGNGDTLSAYIWTYADVSGVTAEEAGRRKDSGSWEASSADFLGQYRIILSADTASEVRQLLSQKRR